MLLQVAVVLVRRVLGRAELRKRCQGQMETLERLRGVREEVQEEDNAFIAEVRRTGVVVALRGDGYTRSLLHFCCYENESNCFKQFKQPDLKVHLVVFLKLLNRTT